MLYGGFRTKERRIIAVILGAVIIAVAWMIAGAHDKDERPTEQAVMAENYLNAGSYEEAVKAYEEALEQKGNDQEALCIGLSDAYVGLKDYDKALEVLHSYYDKLSTEKLKNKIEEVNSAKTDFEFFQSISRADVYFSNKEYDKAISEYEKAKLIKSKDIQSYQRIAQAYIKQEEYDKARNEVIEGYEVTQSEELKDLLDSIDYYLYKEQYDVLIAQAEEYIYQENFEDGLDQYQAAIKLLPKEPDAYKALAQIYIDQEDYITAIDVLKDSVEKTGDSELKEMLSSAQEQKALLEEKTRIIGEISTALEDKDVEKILSLMALDTFKENIASKDPVSYLTGENEDDRAQTLIVYNKNEVYYGNLHAEVKQGVGTYFMKTENVHGPGYYYYEGEWMNDIPNGAGITVEVTMQKDTSGQEYEDMTVTTGSFAKALESGDMNKYFYKNGVESGHISYLAWKGIPQSSGTTRNTMVTVPATSSYSIGELYLGKEKTGEDYKARPFTVWGVKPFQKKR